MKSAYSVLQLSEDVSEAIVRIVAKQLAFERHPDRAKVKDKKKAEQQLKDINWARDTLLDADKRRAHDAELAAARRPPPAPPKRRRRGAGFPFEEDRSHAPRTHVAWVEVEIPVDEHGRPLRSQGTRIHMHEFQTPPPPPPFDGSQSHQSGSTRIYIHPTDPKKR